MCDKKLNATHQNVYFSFSGVIHQVLTNFSYTLPKIELFFACILDDFKFTLFYVKILIPWQNNWPQNNCDKITETK